MSTIIISSKRIYMHKKIFKYAPKNEYYTYLFFNMHLKLNVIKKN